MNPVSTMCYKHARNQIIFIGGGKILFPTTKQKQLPMLLNVPNQDVSRDAKLQFRNAVNIHKVIVIRSNS